MVPMSAVSLLVKGMLRDYIDEHGVAGLVPRRKLPLTNEIITKGAAELEFALIAYPGSAGQVRGQALSILLTSGRL